MFTKHQSILFALVANALGSNKSIPILSLAEGLDHSGWASLLDLAVNQGVTAIAYEGMPQQLRERMPKDIAVRWHLSIEYIVERYQKQCKVLKELTDIYSKQGIDVLVLKGVHLSALYPTPQYRECGDIDIFLYQHYDAGNKIVESMGMRVRRLGLKHSNFHFKGVNVENHKTLLNVKANRFDKNLERELHGFLSRGKRDEFHLLFNIRHKIVHFLSSGLVLRHLCDLYLEITNYKSDFTEVFDILHREKQLGVLSALLLLTGETLGNSAVNGPLDEYCAKRGIENRGRELLEVIYADTFVNSSKRRDLSKEKSMGVLKRKVIGAGYMFKSKWKYDLIERGYFGREFIKRLGYAFKLYKPKGSL